MLHGLGIDTGVRLDAIVDASRRMETIVGHLLPSRVFRAATAPPPADALTR
jgi:hypothetical protein